MKKQAHKHFLLTKRNGKWKTLKKSTNHFSKQKSWIQQKSWTEKCQNGPFTGVFGRSQLLHQFGNSAKLDFAQKRYNSSKSGSDVDILEISSLKTHLTTHQEKIATTEQADTPRHCISIACPSQGWRDIKPAPSDMKINVSPWATPLLNPSYYSPRSQ